MFDSDSSETHDNITLGHTGFWNLCTGGQAKTFSDISNDFYSEYTSMTKREGYGRLIEYYRMAPENVHSTSTTNVLSATPPTFSWTANGTSSSFKNNKFTVRLLSDNCSSSMDISTTSTSLTLTTSQWNTILGWTGDTIHLTVYGYQMTNPTTGHMDKDTKILLNQFIRRVYIMVM